MSRSIALLVSLTALLVVGLEARPRGQAVALGGAEAISLCGNSVKQEPVLNFDVTGATFAGAFHSRVTVYNNGLGTRSKLQPVFGTEEVETVFLSPATVAQLQSDLIAAGAFKLCDLLQSTADIPLTTVTVFQGTTDARAHTYSYFFPVKGHAVVDQIIGDFIDAHFGGNSVSSSL